MGVVTFGVIRFEIVRQDYFNVAGYSSRRTVNLWSVPYLWMSYTSVFFMGYRFPDSPALLGVMRGFVGSDAVLLVHIPYEAD